MKLSHTQQKAILAKQIKAFIKAQSQANEALKAINEIALLENEGNPLTFSLQGTEAVINYATNQTNIGWTQTLEAEAEGLNTLLTESAQIISASGYWASNV